MSPSNRAVFVFFVFLFLLKSAQSCLYKRFHHQHTACKSTNLNCEILKSGVKSTDISLIVGIHNKLRNRIASGEEGRLGYPSAANMLQLRWDKELASIAQSHASQCHFGHELHSQRRSSQNLFLVRSSRGKLASNWTMVVNKWYDELKIAPTSVVNNFNSHGLNIGHFSQIAWAETHKIGCGFVAFRLQGSVYRIAHLYTCNYGPGGNLIGAHMYENGLPTSHCPLCSRRSLAYKALCDRFDPFDRTRVPNITRNCFVRRKKYGFHRAVTHLQNSQVIIRKYKKLQNS